MKTRSSEKLGDLSKVTELLRMAKIGSKPYVIPEPKLLNSIPYYVLRPYTIYLKDFSVSRHIYPQPIPHMMLETSLYKGISIVKTLQQFPKFKIKSKFHSSSTPVHPFIGPLIFWTPHSNYWYLSVVLNPSLTK